MRRNVLFLSGLLVFFTLMSGFSLRDERLSSWGLDVETANSDVQSLIEKRLESMTLDEKIAQLFLIRVNTDDSVGYLDSLEKFVKQKEVGGLVFFKGSPKKQINIIQRLNKVVSIPLLVSMDAEWGLGMRLDSTIAYPFNMTLGAIHDVNKIYKMAFQIGKQLRAVGVQVNFAPVVDINNNPGNPIIGVRSFGDNKKNVTQKALMYLYGLSDANVLGVAKHYPGHGDTHVDSHRNLPVLYFSRTRLDSLELYPYRELIKNGLGAIMTAHINVRSYDRNRRLPATLSRMMITNVLRKKMNFNGIVITDAMEMEGVRKYYKRGNAEYLALRAGNDLICLPENLDLAIKKIKRAVTAGRYSEQEIDKKVRKMLSLKYHFNLFDETNCCDTLNLEEKLNPAAGLKLKQEICDEAVTLLAKSDNMYLNSSNLDTQTTVIVSVVNTRSTEPTKLQREVQKKFPNIENIVISIKNKPLSTDSLSKMLGKYKHIIFSLHDTRRFPWNHYANSQWKITLSEIAKRAQTTLLFTSPYILSELNVLSWKDKNLLICYENSDEMNISALKVLTRDIFPIGQLPVTINPRFKTGMGLH